MPTANTTRTRSTSTVPIRGGKREMKVYPLTEDELENLGALQVLSTLGFSIGSFFAALCFGVKSSVALSNGVQAEVVAWWDAMATSSGVIAAIAFVGGGVAFWRGRSKIGKIKKGTDHG